MEVLLWKGNDLLKILWLTIKTFKYKWLRYTIIEKIEKYLIKIVQSVKKRSVVKINSKQRAASLVGIAT
jgi:hypothetical protein